MIDTREELINALTEAAELEHGLLCQYVFAALTMRKRTDEGLTWQQVELAREWEGTILKVAVQEMAHLGTVSNLLTAVGAAPHFRRPNFPQPARYYPAGVEFTLQRFGDAALARFIQFERPEVEPAVLEIAPEPLTYTRVGDLYSQIKNAFATIDERTLFIGPPGSQDQDDWTDGLRLTKVTDRQSALQAIEFIIEEGEGTPEDRGSSHYASFRRTREALAAEVQRQRGGFDPARPVIDNPLTRPHRDAPGGNVITDPDTLEVAELFNVVYGAMISMLVQFYSFGSESPEQRAGLQASIRQTMSSIIRPLGEILTAMPAGAGFPGQTAGPGFEFYDDLSIPSSPRSSWTLFQERLTKATDECKRLSQKRGAPVRLDTIYQNLYLLTHNIQDLMNMKELA